MQSKNKAGYIEAWNTHINQLVYVAIDGDVPMPELEAIKDSAKAMVQKAADKLEAENHWDK